MDISIFLKCLFEMSNVFGPYCYLYAPLVFIWSTHQGDNLLRNKYAAETIQLGSLLITMLFSTEIIQYNFSLIHSDDIRLSQSCLFLCLDVANYRNMGISDIWDLLWPQCYRIIWYLCLQIEHYIQVVKTEVISRKGYKLIEEYEYTAHSSVAHSVNIPVARFHLELSPMQVSTWRL
jgi:hypothetical protein